MPLWFGDTQEGEFHKLCPLNPKNVLKTAPTAEESVREAVALGGISGTNPLSNVAGQPGKTSEDESIREKESQNINPTDNEDVVMSETPYQDSDDNPVYCVQIFDNIPFDSDTTLDFEAMDES